MDTSCCGLNAKGNNCKAVGASDSSECNFQNDFFPAYEATGNACSGVEVSLTATPNGCGCQPSQSEPCNFDTRLKNQTEACFACTAEAFVEDNMKSGTDNDLCADCLTCIKQQCASFLDSTKCGSGGTILDGTDEAAIQACLGAISDLDPTPTDEDNCRERCIPLCQKQF